MEHCFPESFKFCVNVLYKEEPRYAKGYEMCKAYHPWARFVVEDNFKKQVLDLVNPCRETTMFAVDDIVWKNQFSTDCREYETFVKSNNTICLSLRLWPGISWSYMLDRPANKPRFINQWIWQANQGGADWCYPMSVDCNIYQTKDILPLLKAVVFNAPNSLEGALSRNPIHKRYMQCFYESKIINIPANRVQNEALKNRSGNSDCVKINSEFILGRGLSFDKLIGYKNKAGHEPMELVWRPL